MNWQPYFQAKHTSAPSLCIRLINPLDPTERPIHLNARLDSGGVGCGIPMATVDAFRKAKLPLLKAEKRKWQGAFDVEAVQRQTFRFRVAIYAISKPVGECRYEKLEESFQQTQPLYSTEHRNPPFLEMVPIPKPFALIGRDILNEWTVILHGPARSLKVFNRGCTKVVFSLSPGVEELLRKCFTTKKIAAYCG